MRAEGLRLRPTRQCRKSPASILSINSNTAAVGKTNTTANRTMALFAAHKTVLLLNHHTPFGNRDLILNINCKYHLSRMITGRNRLAANMAETTSHRKKTHQQITKDARRSPNVHLYDIAVLLRDERITAAARPRKTPVSDYPKAQINASLVALAAKDRNAKPDQISKNTFLPNTGDWFFLKSSAYWTIRTYSACSVCARQ